jgi:hypothetical protein
MTPKVGEEKLLSGFANCGWLNAQFVQPGAAKRVGVGQRENPEAGITGTRKPIDIPDGIKAITWECDLLIVIGEKKSAGDFAFLCGEIINIGHKLVFVEMARAR